jgi:hypothetical protein
MRFAVMAMLLYINGKKPRHGVQGFSADVGAKVERKQRLTKY